jgi:transposase
MLTITNTMVTREHVGAAFRRTHDVRLRERYHTILQLMDGKSCPEIAQWLYRDEETIRTWVQAFNEAGVPGLERAPRKVENLSRLYPIEVAQVDSILDRTISS